MLRKKKFRQCPGNKTGFPYLWVQPWLSPPPPLREVIDMIKDLLIIHWLVVDLPL